MGRNSLTLRAGLNYPPVQLKFCRSGQRGLVADLTPLEIYVNATAELEYLQSLPQAEGGITFREPWHWQRTRWLGCARTKNLRFRHRRLAQSRHIGDARQVWLPCASQETARHCQIGSRHLHLQKLYLMPRNMERP